MNEVQGGTRGAERSAWFAALRARFVSLARRRVAPDAVEDVVQDALRIVVERGFDRPGAMSGDGVPALASCFVVLRNVIGNHYQKESVRQRSRETMERAEGTPDDRPTPIESLVSEDALRVIAASLGDLEGSDPACARFLRRLAEGGSPFELATEEKLAPSVFYRRVYRCRVKLRALLERRGYFA